MAQGDIVIWKGTVANGAYLTCQPSAGNEVVIKNIYHSGSIEVSRFDNTNEAVFLVATGSGGLLSYTILVTNSDYLRIRNISGATIYIVVDGVQTK